MPLNSKQLKCTINFHLKQLLEYQQKYKKTDDFYIEIYNYLKEIEKEHEFNSSQKQILYAREIEEKS